MNTREREKARNAELDAVRIAVTNMLRAQLDEDAVTECLQQVEDLFELLGKTSKSDKARDVLIARCAVIIVASRVEKMVPLI